MKTTLLIGILFLLLSNLSINAQDYFWLSGSEPGWNLEIDKDKWIVFVTDYGEEMVTFPYRGPIISDGFWFYRTSIKGKNYDPEIKIMIYKEQCVNDAEEVMDYRAEVIWKNKVVTGCGRLTRKSERDTKPESEVRKKTEADNLKSDIDKLFKKDKKGNN